MATKPSDLPASNSINSTNSEKGDRYRIRYTVVFVMGFLSLQFYGIFNSSSDSAFSGILLLVSLALILAFYFGITIIYSFYMKYWKRLLSMLIAPILTFGIFQAESYTGITPDYVRLLLVRSEYLDQVRKMEGDKSLFFAWLWDRTWGVGTTQTQTILIYDETDQILLSPEMRSVYWTERVVNFSSAERLDLRSIANPTPYSARRHTPSIRKLANHFYLVTEAM